MQIPVKYLQMKIHKKKLDHEFNVCAKAKKKSRSHSISQLMYSYHHLDAIDFVSFQILRQEFSVCPLLTMMSN